MAFADEVSGFSGGVFSLNHECESEYLGPSIGLPDPSWVLIPNQP